MFKQLFYSDGKFSFTALFALSTSVLSGIAGAGYVITINEAAGEIIQGKVHLNYLPFFIATTAAMIILRRIALRQATEHIEGILENFRNKLANQIRQIELAQMETIDKTEIYLKMTSDTKSF
ncbi:MAG: hypothetical protein HQK77_20950, partial [Desulfobacterales bacterium]|nr:hypothetical protein [Desulfobacterales bacterium]